MTISKRTDTTVSATPPATPSGKPPADRSAPSRRAARKARTPGRTSFGSVRELPSGRYQARFTTTGSDRQGAPQTFATRREAEDYIATVRADIVRGHWRAPELGAVTLADYSTRLLAVRVDLAPKTQQLYEELLRLWINADHELVGQAGRSRTINLGDLQLADLDVATVRDWYAAAIRTTDDRAARRAEAAGARADTRAGAVHPARAWAHAQGLQVAPTGRLPAAVLDAWKDAGGGRARRSIRDSTVPTALHGQSGRANLPGRARVAQAYRYLKTVLQQAVRDGRIDANPCQIPSGGLVRTPERVPATPEQIDALAAAMPPRWSAAVQVSAWSGLRAGELFGLARRHIDLQAGTVRVERAVTYLPSKPPFLGPTKTPSSRRIVHLPPHVVDILAEHLDRYTQPGPDALVFADERGQIAPAKLRSRAYRRARTAIGRPDLTWHDLRHTGATIAAQAGASLRELQHRLGHSTVRAAMLYQHADARRDHELAQAMSQLAAPSVGNVVAMDAARRRAAGQP